MNYVEHVVKYTLYPFYSADELSHFQLGVPSGVYNLFLWDTYSVVRIVLQVILADEYRTQVPSQVKYIQEWEYEQKRDH